jgi:transcriptional regulator with XRE-family HTH domain
VAARAEVSAATVARIEHGQLDRLQVGVIRKVLKTLEMDLALEPRWRGGELDRLADEGHALLVGRAAALLESEGWVVQPEVSYSVWGERGSIDLLAWHARTRTLLVVEVKTTLNSIEETLRRQDAKARLSAGVARERFDWEARATARLLVLPDDAAARRRVARHAAVLDRAYPSRGYDARAWIRSPQQATGMLVFLRTSGKEAARTD